MVRKRSRSDESGNMILALMLALLLISVSLIALSVLTWQLKKGQSQEAEWETQMALNSGVAWAAQTISTSASDSTCANLTTVYPSNASTAWSTNTANAGTSSRDEAVGAESGLYRWYILSCTPGADGKASQVKVKVDATNKNASTRNQGFAASSALQSVTLVFQNRELVYVLNS